MQFSRPSAGASVSKEDTHHDKSSAEDIAVKALQYLADDSELLSRFLSLTGLAPNELREASKRPEFLIAVLDFFMGHEPNLLSFAESSGLAPESIAKARFLLSSEEHNYD